MVVMVYRGNVITISCPKFSFSRNGPLSSRNTPPARPEPLVYRVTSIVKRAQRHCYRLCLEKEGRRIESPSANSLLKSIIEKGKVFRSSNCKNRSQRYTDLLRTSHTLIDVIGLITDTIYFLTFASNASSFHPIVPFLDLSLRKENKATGRSSHRQAKKPMRAHTHARIGRRKKTRKRQSIAPRCTRRRRIRCVDSSRSLNPLPNEKERERRRGRRIVLRERPGESRRGGSRARG